MDCGSYRPGHFVHWIQAKKSWEEPGLVESGTIVRIDPPLVEVKIGSELRRYFNHEAVRLGLIAQERGSTVRVQERWSLLKVPSEGGDYCFSIARADSDWKPCKKSE